MAELASPSVAAPGTEHGDLTSRSGLSRRAVVVGLANGLVCVVDLKSSRVIRALNTGHRVTSVAVVASMGGPMANHRNIAETV